MAHRPARPNRQGTDCFVDELRDRKVNLISLKDGLDLSTPAGRLMANVLASVTQYETEVRGEQLRVPVESVGVPPALFCLLKVQCM